MPLRFRVYSPIFAAIAIAALVAPSRAQESAPPAPHPVDLKAPDAVPLKATFFPAGKPGPGILLLHQCNRQRKVWDGLAAKLAAAGMNVLTLDFRGFGESSGEAAYKLPPAENAKMLAETWPGDVDIAYQYLRTQPSVNKELIGAGGASCGVHQAVMFAKRHPEVRSLVLLSEMTDRDGRQFIRNSPQLPILMAAADDDFGEVEVMQWLADISPNPSTKLLHYQTGGHGVDMFTAHPELPDTIVKWFSTTLTAAPAAPQSEKKPLSRNASLLNLLDEPGGAAKAVEIYNEEHKRDPKYPPLSETIVNRIGYEHLALGDTQDAIQILRMNVTAYPNSANAYDSLSDAYFAAGQKDLARQNAKKALELLATDTSGPAERRKGIQESAEQKLKQLGDTTP